MNEVIEQRARLQQLIGDEVGWKALITCNISLETILELE